MVEYFPNPENMQEQVEKNKSFEFISASDADVEWIQDANAYFTIMPYYKKNKLMVRCYTTDHKPKYLIEGDTPVQVYHKISQLGLLSLFEHAAYLGKELQKAYTALQQHLLYVQDDDLDESKKIDLDK